MLGMALPCESGTGFLVTLDADGLLYPFVAPADVVVTGHELFLKKFFWTLDTKPATIHIKECQSAIFGEPFLRVLVGSLFVPLQRILSEIEDLIPAQSAGEATIPAALGERMDEEIALEVALIDAVCDTTDVAQIDSMCDTAPSYNPEIEISALASSVCEQFFGKSCKLFGIRGDGNCFCRCLATIVYWLFKNLEDSPVRTKFLDEFSKVIKSFSEGTTIKTASDCHQNVRDLINSHLQLQFSARDVVDNNCANKRCGDCSNICQCQLRQLFPPLFDFENGLRAELLNGILSEMDKSDLSHKDIFDFIGINSKDKVYSACTTVSMGFELLNKYSHVQLVTIQHNNRAGDSPFSIRGDLHQKDDCQLATIVVLEEHNYGNLNHYSILVQSEQKQICIPMIDALSILSKAQGIRDEMGKVPNGIIVEENGVSFELVDSPHKEDLSRLSGIVKIPKKVAVKTEFNALANAAPLQLLQRSMCEHTMCSPKATACRWCVECNMHVCRNCESVMHLDRGALEKPHQVSDFDNRSVAALTTEVPKPRDNASGDSKGDADQTKGDSDRNDIKP